MNRRPSRWLFAAALPCALACDRYVSVGYEDLLSVAGAAEVPSRGGAGAAAGGGSSSATGGSGGGAAEAGSSAEAGGAGEGGNSEGELPWRADHELGTLDEWLVDGQGWQFLAGTGQLAISTEHAHSGTYSFSSNISPEDGEVHQAVIGRNVTLPEGRYGAWYFLPEPPTADTWVIMKLSNGRDRDRFDIDVQAGAGEPARLRLFEHRVGWITEPASVALPVDRWVHVEVLYRSTPEDNGRLVVLQDGVSVLDSGPRPTADDATVSFICGSASRDLVGAPYRLFIDDASISADAVP